jgi:hypothetical protein
LCGHDNLVEHKLEQSYRNVHGRVMQNGQFCVDWSAALVHPVAADAPAIIEWLRCHVNSCRGRNNPESGHTRLALLTPLRMYAGIIVVGTYQVV